MYMKPQTLMLKTNKSCNQVCHWIISGLHKNIN